MLGKYNISLYSRLVLKENIHLKSALQGGREDEFDQKRPKKFNLSTTRQEFKDFFNAMSELLSEQCRSRTIDIVESKKTDYNEFLKLAISLLVVN